MRFVPKKESKKEPLLRKDDFSSYLEEKAREMAPRDVEALLAQAEKARESAYSLSDRIGNQMSLAIELLTDHHNGECPQIPYYTISLLAEAVYYFLDPNDVIPDWIPEIGRLDDALVVELAFERGVDGVRRYCAWKGIDDSAIYPPVPLRPAAAAIADEPAPKTAKKVAKKKSTSAKSKSKAKPKAAKKKAKKAAKSPRRATAKRKSKRS